MKQRRKLTSSIVLLIVASIVLASGTYAWFVAGGLANMFTLDYNAVEAGEGLEVQGSAGNAYVSQGGAKQEWGSYLAYDNFNAGELLAEGTGIYTPVSLATKGANPTFVKAFLKGDTFNCTDAVKGTNYNDFSLKVRGSSAAPSTAQMKIKISGNTTAAGGKVTDAGRVAVTIDGTTTVYALNDTSDSYVTKTFEGTVKDTDGNQIITTADDGYANAGLTSGSVTKLNSDGTIGSTGNGIVFDLAANQAEKTINVQTWIEGNDPNCIDATKGGVNSIAGGQFVVDISFETVD